MPSLDLNILEALQRWFTDWKPKQLEPLSIWSAKNARLDDGSSYTAFPFQDGWADAMSDPDIPDVSVKKSSRVGYSQTVKNLIGWGIDQKPSQMILYFPTIRDAEKFSRKEVARVQQWPIVRRRVQYTTRDPRNALRQKEFPGGSMLLNGTNSPGEFRADTADWVICEEVDGYKEEAGVEGDILDLAFKRTQTSDEPKRIAGSTPTLAGSSKIDERFKLGTQEYRHVPCPHCGLKQKLIFGTGDDGPGLKWWPKDRPTRAWYRCEAGCEIEEHHKGDMDAAGEWIAAAPENWPHRSFHIWEIYSQFPGAAWLTIANRFIAAKGNRLKLKVFINQVLAETYEAKGEAPEWRRLYERREHWPADRVPKDALILIAGIDVQGNRVEVFVWGFGADSQCWLVDHIVIPTSPYVPETWPALTKALRRTWRHEGGAEMRLYRVAIDTGYATMQVEAWARRHPGFVTCVKGATTIGAPAFAWSGARGTQEAGGKASRTRKRLGMIGGHVLTMELYGALGLDPPTEEEQAAGALFPVGYVHLGEKATEEICKQMVGDQWMESRGEWKKVHADEALDGWKYARAMCVAIGLDRWPAARWRQLASAIRGQEGDQPSDRSAPTPAVQPVQDPPKPPPAAMRAISVPKVGRSSYMSRLRR